MKIFGIGLIIGVIIGGGGLILWDRADLPLPSTSPTITTTDSAGTAGNLSSSFDPSEQISLIVEIADLPRTDDTDNPTDLTSLEITLTKAEITLIRSSADGAERADLPRAEVLNLRQPTIDLLSLRGSGLGSQLGLTPLVAGTYRDLSLTIGSIKGRTTTGATIDIPITPGATTVTLDQEFDWTTAGTTHTVQIDLDSFDSLHQTETTYQLTPAISQVTEDGLIRP